MPVATLPILTLFGRDHPWSDPSGPNVEIEMNWAAARALTGLLAEFRDTPNDGPQSALHFRALFRVLAPLFDNDIAAHLHPTRSTPIAEEATLAFREVEA